MGGPERPVRRWPDAAVPHWQTKQLADVVSVHDADEQVPAVELHHQVCAAVPAQSAEPEPSATTSDAAEPAASAETAAAEPEPAATVPAVADGALEQHHVHGSQHVQ